MGFRGSKVKVVYNTGFELIDSDLKFNKKAHNYSFKTGKRIKKKQMTKEDPNMVRNSILFSIGDGEDVIYITLTNVNEYNLQPCRININQLSNRLLKNSTGCMVDIKYSVNCGLNTITDTDIIEEPTEKQLLKLPKTEHPPTEIKHIYV